MTELIVALDGPIEDMNLLADRLIQQAEVHYFKLGVAALLSHSGYTLADYLIGRGCQVMLDLKLYDTQDTVTEIMRLAANLSIWALTLHAKSDTTRLISAALREERPYPSIFLVDQLTDTNTSSNRVSRTAELARDYGADGLICPPDIVSVIKYDYPTLITVCPGVRRTDDSRDNHCWTATPGQAKRFGADYIVIGRPIYRADDPALAARAIQRELKK